ncbi:MAG TPA: WD40 repeat domain-containing protein, partial [Abditibacteriaceae bacterium]
MKADLRHLAKYLAVLCSIGLILTLSWHIGDWMGERAGRLPATSEPFPTSTPTPPPPPRIVIVPPPRIIARPKTPTVPSVPRLDLHDDKLPLTFSHNGELLVAAHAKGAFSLYRRRDSKKLKSWPANGAEVTSITFSANNQFFAVAHFYAYQSGSIPKGQVQIFTTNSLKRYRFWKNLDAPEGVRFSPDAKYLAVSNKVGFVTLYSLGDGSKKRHFSPPKLPMLLAFGTNSSAKAMDFSPDGRFFAAADISGSIAIWRTKDGVPQAFAIAEG